MLLVVFLIRTPEIQLADESSRRKFDWSMRRPAVPEVARSDEIEVLVDILGRRQDRLLIRLIFDSYDIDVEITYEYLLSRSVIYQFSYE